MRRMGAAVCLSAMLAVGGFCARAQTADTSQASDSSAADLQQQLLSSYEGQNVTSVELAGQPELNQSQFTSLFTLHAGQPFSLAQAQQTVAALKATGKFEQMRIEADPQPKGVRVLFVPEPAVYFGIFEFPGADRFPYSQLIQQANYPVQTPFNQGDMDEAQQGLLTFFRQEGYFQADVHA